MKRVLKWDIIKKYTMNWKQIVVPTSLSKNGPQKKKCHSSGASIVSNRSN